MYTPKDERCFLVVMQSFRLVGEGRMPMRRLRRNERHAGRSLAVVAMLATGIRRRGRGAVDHSKQGHIAELVAHAEAALQHALNGGKDRSHVDEGIAHLKAAIEHGKAGHADVATKHAETAVMHLSQGR